MVVDHNEKLIISVSPHIQNKESTVSMIYIVILFLLPACIFGFMSFGFSAVAIVLLSILFSVLTEIVCQLIMRRPVTIYDGSAILTGLLLGMTMPPTVPLYIPILSAIFAIAIVKQAFGGLGQNWANPAIAGRVFATLSWPAKMQTWLPPFSSDGLTAATPLSAVQSALLNGGNYGNESSIQLLDTLSGDVLRSQIDYLRMFFGFRGGCIGEVSAFLLILAALFLLYRKIITIDIPVSFLSTAAIMAWIFEGTKFGGPLFTGDPLFHLLSGGMILAAFFMATDVVTTPLTTKGRIIFGIGCGMITMLIRIWGSYAEGVGLAILFMNMLTPAIDRYVRNYPAGWHKKRKKLNEN
jgi:electron transport complex protein RnfD